MGERYPAPKVLSDAFCGNAPDCEISSIATPSNHALPENAPPSATSSAMRSCERVAVKLIASLVQPRVPPSDSEMHVERHGRHGERCAGRDGSAIQIADLEIFGAHPAGEFVALANGQIDRGRLHE